MFDFDGKAELSVAHDPSEIIVIWRLLWCFIFVDFVQNSMMNSIYVK